MKKLLRSIKVFLGLEDACDHEKEIFCVSRIAFVKCLKCGFESLPWEVSQLTADRWREINQDKIDKLLAYNRSRRK